MQIEGMAPAIKALYRFFLFLSSLFFFQIAEGYEENMDETILEMKNITKTFPGVKALSNVSFRVKRKEIHCLVGENGAGKSTLMKVLSGVYPHNEYTGEIFFNGKVQSFKHISDSENAVIGIIYQELALVPDMTVYENIFLGHEYKKGL